MTQFFQTLVDGLTVGSLYALIALGYTMVYGILKFINFAHSDVFAKFSCRSPLPRFWCGVVAGGTVPPWYVGALVLRSRGRLGVGFSHRTPACRARAPRLNVLITAIGVSLLR
jgi:branched-chain amino acid transport system permease protein